MKRIFVLALLSGLVTLSAAPLNFNVSVDTSAFDTLDGTISFQFNTGGVDAATATISGFSGATLGSSTATSGVSGTLPGVVSISFVDVVNELLQNVTFGSSFQFALSISGDLVDNPADLFGAGASFGLLVTQGNTTLQSIIDVFPGGDAFVSADPTATIEAGDPISPVPEPASVLLMVSAIPAVWLLKRGR